VLNQAMKELAKTPALKEQLTEALLAARHAGAELGRDWGRED
jgi:hypothetical protein